MTDDITVGRIDLGPTEPRRLTQTEQRAMDGALRRAVVIMPAPAEPTIYGLLAGKTREQIIDAWMEEQLFFRGQVKRLQGIIRELHALHISSADLFRSARTDVVLTFDVTIQPRSTTTMRTTTASLSLFDKIETVGHECLTAVEHAAAWLVGKVASADTSLHALEASSPLVAEAIAAGEASAAAHGIPVAAIESAGEEVLGMAKQLAGSLSAPPPPPPVVQQPAA